MSPQGEISGVPVSHKDNNGVYSAVRQITELRQTVGCVYQHQRRSPRLHINASLTLHLYMAGFGEWPTIITSFPLLVIPFISNLLNLLLSPSTLHFLFFIFAYLPLLLQTFLFLPPVLTPPLSAACHAVPFILSACVCQAYPSRLIYYAVGETKVQEMEVRTHH